MLKIKSLLKDINKDSSLFFDYRVLLFIFFLIHFILVLLFGKYLVIFSGYNNLVHKNNLLIHPEWWKYDGPAGFNFAQHAMFSAFTWLFILIHNITRIPLEWFLTLEILLKPLVLLYLMALIFKCISDKKINYAIPLMLLAFKGFLVLNINLHGFIFKAYKIYQSDLYYILFLIGLLSIYRRSWNILAFILFFGAIAHPALGLPGGILLTFLAISHDIPKPDLKKLIIFASAGFLFEFAIIKYVLSGMEIVPKEVMAKNVFRNPHFLFPFLFKGRFIRSLFISTVFFAITYYLSKSQRLKKDLLICFIFVVMSIIVYFLIAIFKNLGGLKLCVMRGTPFIFIIGLVNLVSVNFDNISLKEKVLTAFLFLLLMYRHNAAGLFFPYSFYYLYGAEIFLAVVIYFIIVILLRLNFRKCFILLLSIPFFISPILYTLSEYRKGKPFLEMFNHISANISKGTVFLEWGGNHAIVPIAKETCFRMYTNSQIVNPGFLGSSYTGIKVFLDDEIRKVECLLGREIEAVKIYDNETIREVRKKLSEPMNKKQLSRFKELYNVEYIIYPVKLKKPDFEYVIIYSDVNYNILKV